MEHESEGLIEVHIHFWTIFSNKFRWQCRLLLGFTCKEKKILGCFGNHIPNSDMSLAPDYLSETYGN